MRRPATKRSSSVYTTELKERVKLVRRDKVEVTKNEDCFL